MEQSIIGMDDDVPAMRLEDVYRQHGHVVLRRAHTLLGNESDALDVLQQIFLSLVDRPERFQGRSAVTTWLYRVTTNACLNRLRDHKNRQRLLEERGNPIEPRPPRGDLADWASARQFIDRMPDELAQVTIYYAIDGMTQKEIAEILGCSRRHVGNLLERVRSWAQAQDRDV